jgi:cysteine desulfurase
MQGWRETEGPRLRAMRDALLARLRESLPLVVNGAIDPPWWESPGEPRLRLPHNLNVTLLGVDGPEFHRLVRDRVALSAGSACKALGGQRSHVLDAVGAPTDGAVVRVGLGSCNDDAQVNEAAAAIVESARRAAK